MINLNNKICHFNDFCLVSWVIVSLFPLITAYYSEPNIPIVICKCFALHVYICMTIII